MDGLQLLLVIIIVSLTSVLLVVGVQVFLAVREVRRLVKRIQKTMDDPADKISSFLENLKKKAS